MVNIFRFHSIRYLNIFLFLENNTLLLYDEGRIIWHTPYSKYYNVSIFRTLINPNKINMFFANCFNSLEQGNSMFYFIIFLIIFTFIAIALIVALCIKMMKQTKIPKNQIRREVVHMGNVPLNNSYLNVGRIDQLPLYDEVNTEYDNYEVNFEFYKLKSNVFENIFIWYSRKFIIIK